jgi:hypothetical protein
LHIEPASEKNRGIITEKTTKMAEKMAALHRENIFWRGTLSDRLSDFLIPLNVWLQTSGPNLIIDMSAMPKKFLAIVVLWALRHDHIKNIIVAYTKAVGYTSEPLAEDQGPVSPINGLSRDDFVDEPIKKVIMGLGYMAFDLGSITDNFANTLNANVIFPFPPGAPSFQRNWKLLHNLFGAGNEIPEPIRIDSRDVSYTFDVLNDLTGNGQDFTVLLPFGPKPHSLAMILHSISKRSEVRYSQPSYYHPEYSQGIATINGVPEIYGYAIRLNGEYLYGQPAKAA